MGGCGGGGEVRAMKPAASRHVNAVVIRMAAGPARPCPRARHR
ncbi:hypothetical protein KPATCC21470_7500 [Kitasatospora purpeofusca]